MNSLLSSLARKFPCMLMKTRNFESGGGYPPPCLLSKWGTVHSLAATARAATRHTSVAAAVAGHDGSADRAAWGVAHVDQLFESIGCVVMAGGRAAHEVVSRQLSVVSDTWRAFHEVSKGLLPMSVLARRTGGRGIHVLRTQAFEEGLLLPGQEAQLQPAEDVIHDRLGVADIGIAAPAAGFEAGMRELFAQQLERHAVLQADGDCAGEAVHEAADGGAFLGHGDEDLTRHAVFVKADGEIAFVSADVELVRDRQALVGQTMTDGFRRRESGISRFFRPTLWDSHRRGLGAWLCRRRSHRAEWLRLLGAVAVNGNRLEAELPCEDVGLHDLFDRRAFGHVDRLG